MKLFFGAGKFFIFEFSSDVLLLFRMYIFGDQVLPSRQVFGSTSFGAVLSLIQQVEGVLSLGAI